MESYGNSGNMYGGPARDTCYNCMHTFNFSQRQMINEQARACPSSGSPTCYNCNLEGHKAAECTEPQRERTCYRCGEVGHLSRECTSARTASNYGGMSGSECYKCGEVGHVARQCSNSGFRDSPRITCYACGGTGHMARECMQGQQKKCYACGKIGHMSRECERAPSARVCYLCQEAGHIRAECPNAAQ